MIRPRATTGSFVLALTVVAAPSARAQAIVHHFQGAAGGDLLGSAIAGIGDVDGDGRADFVIGSPEATTNAFKDGRATVYSGADGSELASFVGNKSVAKMGYAVSGVGDWNVDGVPDFALGVPGDASGGSNQGAVHVISGADFTTLDVYYGVGNSNMGRAVAGVGDLDGDGRVELMTCESATAIAYAYVISSATDAVLYQIPVDDPFAVGRVGDLNGDGVTELIVCDPYWSLAKGRALIYSGADGSLFRTHAGTTDSWRFAEAYTRMGDVNGDGVGDYAISALRDSSVFVNGGSVTVFSGATGDVIHELHGFKKDMFMGQALSSLDDVTNDGVDDLLVGSTDFMEVYSGADWSRKVLSWTSAHCVANVGDVTGDGRSDFAAGHGHSLLPPAYAGEAWVFDGASSVLGGELYCPGVACPCGNDAQGGGNCPSLEQCGCVNSAGVASHLWPLATTSAAADDLYLYCGNLPAQTVALLISGTQAGGGGAGLPFGDGLLCVGGTVQRLAVGSPEFGVQKFGPGLGATAGWAAGDTRYLQVWYRDVVGSPCGKDFNLTNGVKLTFTP